MYYVQTFPVLGFYTLFCAEPLLDQVGDHGPNEHWCHTGSATI